MLLVSFCSPVFLMKLDDLVVDIFLIGDVLLHLQVLTVQFIIVVPYFCCSTPRKTSLWRLRTGNTTLCLNTYTAVCVRPAGRRCCHDRSDSRYTSPALSVRQKDTCRRTTRPFYHPFPGISLRAQQYRSLKFHRFLTDAVTW